MRRFITLRITFLSMLVGITGSALPSVAAPTYFFNDIVTSRDAFRAAAPALQLESFEDFNPGTSVAFPGFTVTSNLDLFEFPSSILSRLVSDDTQAMAVSEEDLMFVTFTFDSPIRAFGIDVNDLSFLNLSFADSLGNTLPNVLLGDAGGPAGGPGFENRQFFGVVNDQSFQSVTFLASTATNSGTLSFDKLEFSTEAAPIPEPSTFGLALLGVAGALLLRARR